MKNSKPTKTTSRYILERKSRIHGTGVFAKTDIPEGARVLEYVGDKITKAESDKRYQRAWENSQNGNGDKGIVYIFNLNKKYDIDGDVWWNTAKYINHSCDPNCDTEIIQGHIWIVAQRDIKKGEEISYNYGYDLESWEDHPCRCGSDNCIGYILAEEYWPQLRRQSKYRAINKFSIKKKPE